MTRRKLVLGAFAAGDAIALLLGCYAAAVTYDPTWWERPEEMLAVRVRLRDLAMGLLLLAAWLLVFLRFGLYRERYMALLKLRQYEAWDLVKAISFGTLLLIGAAFFADRLHYVTADVVLAFWVANTVAALAVRELLTLLLRLMRLHGRNLRHLLIIGTNRRARKLAAVIQAHPELGYSIRGFVDNRWQGSDYGEGELVASLDAIGPYLRTHVVDEVLIALPMATLYEKAAHVVKLCENQGIVVHFLPGFDFLNAGSSRAAFDSLEGEPVIIVLPPPMDGWQFALKRLIDVTGAGLGLLLLSPVLLAVALAIKLTSEGPVLFVQERVGLNKRIFRMLKFRTMVKNAEDMRQAVEHLNEASGPVFKIENDPRVTRLGAFLRRTSLDELPQLMNVLRGDMSLVGPRPLPLCDYAGFERDWHRRRFSVRPGITCLWQVRGRSSLAFDQWMELDMEYINRWSVWLDIRILAETIRAVVAQKGAV
jgi:exopolysaccharide biosynthesis polyprenyl glycosylphosphotransferase